ncbi:hypothetical protein HPP92_003642 [Vanilla planifolia]|uniref:Bifunctional inhibitor/plant lipid transfer protein/seed storage helical domain-containing protein n=1 Tax=Vanilla planifolia TaxID=51239 RepID=A0A835S3D5_VANPL|nr:hypothetical protein HPP92_003642 [Vanilla planifolia]
MVTRQPLVCSQSFLLLLFFLWTNNAELRAPSPSSSLSVDCTSTLLKLSGCLPYVEEGSTMTKPDDSCCSPLKKVVNQRASCLCEAFRSSSNMGISLNITKARDLPSACGVDTALVSNCMLEAPEPSPSVTPSSGEQDLSVAPAPENSQGSLSSGIPSLYVTHAVLMIFVVICCCNFSTSKFLLKANKISPAAVPSNLNFVFLQQQKPFLALATSHYLRSSFTCLLSTRIQP